MARGKRGPRRKPLFAYCWRCKGARVKVVGMPCPACYKILVAEYDRQRAANGGHLLFIPDDWDGPAKSVNEVETRDCAFCRQPFTLDKQGSNAKYCYDCRPLVIAIQAVARKARRGQSNDSRDFAIATKHIA